MLEALTIKEVENIIRAAEELNAKHPPSELGISPATHDSRSYMTDQKTLVQKISALSHDARMELMALIWIGRDFEGNYNDALEYAHQESGEGDVRYIAEKSPALPIFLKMDEKGWSRVTWQSGYFGSLADIAQSIVMSALPPKADMCSATRHVRFVPIADIAAYSITSSARVSIAVGRARVWGVK